MTDSASALRSRIRGLYLVTPDRDDTAGLVKAVGQALEAGARLVQYRNKSASAAVRRDQITALLARCRAADALLVVNDDWRLGVALGAVAVHLGRDDDDPATVRAAVGDRVLIGVSCYASLERAATLAPVADYLAFGACFASSTKPAAPPVGLDTLAQARRFGLPVVAIGGIDASNLTRVMRHGADAAALISAVFARADPGPATRELLAILAQPDADPAR